MSVIRSFRVYRVFRVVKVIRVPRISLVLSLRLIIRGLLRH